MQEISARKTSQFQSNDQLNNLSSKIKIIESQIQQINRQLQIPGTVIGAQNIQGQNMNSQSQNFSGLRNLPIQNPVNQTIQNQSNQMRMPTQINSSLRQRQYTPGANTNNSNGQQNLRVQLELNNQNPNR